ncbi:hypothetical protein Tco_0837740 [Tanacetum coccineum]
MQEMLHIEILAKDEKSGRARIEVVVSVGVDCYGRGVADGIVRGMVGIVEVEVSRIIITGMVRSGGV